MPNRGLAGNAARPVIQVIDPDPLVRNDLRKLLGALGYEVKTYALGGEFLAESVPGLTSCVVMELRLPDLCGLELLGRIKARRRSVPVLVLTAEGQVSRAVDAMHAGAVDVMEKPYVERILVNSIRRCLEDAA